MCFNIRNIHSFQLVLVLCMHPNFTTTPLIIAHRRRRTCFTIALFLVWILFCCFFSATNITYIYIQIRYDVNEYRWLEIEKQTLLRVVGWDLTLSHTLPNKVMRCLRKMDENLVISQSAQWQRHRQYGRHIANMPNRIEIEWMRPLRWRRKSIK